MDFLFKEIKTSLIDCNLISMASALTIGTLLFSFYNLLTPAKRIRISFIGMRNVWLSLGFFFAFAFVANLLPYINEPTIWYFGYPIFWDIFALLGFFSFLFICYKVEFGTICYKKGKEKVFHDYIEKCIQENVSAKCFYKDVFLSLNNIFSDYEKDKDGKCTWNVYAIKAMIFLSSKNIASEFVENYSELVKTIVKNYADFEGKNINTLLLQRIIVEMALDENSLYNKHLIGNYNSEIEELLSKKLVDKYDVLSFFDAEHERLKSVFALDVFENVVIAVMCKMDKFTNSVHSCLRVLNERLVYLDRSGITGIRCVFERALDEIVVRGKEIDDNGSYYDYDLNKNFDLRSGFKKQFIAFFNSFEQKNKNDEFLYGALGATWDILQENKENVFAKELLNEIVEQAKNNPDLNRFIQVMENKGAMPQSSQTETPLQPNSEEKGNTLMARIEKFIKEHLL